MLYKHTQKSLMMIIVMLAVFALFAWGQIMSSLEPVSVDSGTNLLVTSTMLVVLVILSSFITLQVTIDKQDIHLKFGYGLFKRTFSLKDIVSAKTVKNHRYYGRGIRLWLWPKMWIFNVGGFDAVEIKIKNGNRYRIGTDDAKKLEEAILVAIK
ncbi:MAG: hypothetical protein WCO66_02870 [Candidatus Absconditabacteria bacterium]